MNGRTAIEGFALSIGAARSFPKDYVVDSNGKFDVLELLLADVLELQIETVADIVPHRLGNRDSSGLGHCFQARGDIDAIAVKVVVIDDHVAEVDADPKLDPPIFGNVVIAAAHFPLNLGGAVDGVHDAWELGEQTVAGQLDNSPLVSGDSRVEQFRPMRLEAGERGHLVSAHQPAVTNYIGSHDR